MLDISVAGLHESEVEAALTSLEQSEETEVSVEFTGNGRVDPSAVALLSNLLLANGRHLHIRVTDAALVERFPRLGLASAISRGPHRSDADPPILTDARWSEVWTRASRAPTQAMFADTDSTGSFGPTFATFNDPHLTLPKVGPSALSQLVCRWVSRRDVASDEAGVERVAFFVNELLGNVREHAVSDDRAPIRSLVRVALEQDDVQRWQFVLFVVDTGPGVEHTLRPKLDDDEALDGPSLLRSLLSGELPGWGRARGIGLSRCFEVVMETAGASMMLASRGIRCHGSADEDLRVEQRAAVQGTVAVVVFPI